MRHRSDGQPLQLSPLLRRELAVAREHRAFAPAIVAHAKAVLLNRYMAQAGLKAVVVAVSGGIDSAVVLSLAHMASKLPGSPIHRIVPVLLPVRGTAGATNQDEASSKGHELASGLGLQAFEIDLGDVHAEATRTVQKALSLPGSPWADGQIVATLRTPALYYVTSLLVDAGLPAIVLGTTNRDEGAYLGYFGKASDGMVDVQLISDLHKSEVRALAHRLMVPSSIIDAIPTGDMWDGSQDEQVFGTTYDAVELHHLLKARDAQEGIWRAGDTEAVEADLAPHAEAIESLHRYNGHKYLGRSPAVHLDVLEAWMPGGWDNRFTQLPKPLDALPPGAVGGFDLPSHLQLRPGPEPSLTMVAGLGGILGHVDGLLDQAGLEGFLAALAARKWVEAGIDGRPASHSGTAESLRLSAYSPAVAAQLWKALRPLVPSVKVLTEEQAVEHGGHQVWRAIGVNPLLRFIGYPAGGKLIPHYDAPFVFDDEHRTLMSLVLYLAGNPKEGPTQFLSPGALEVAGRPEAGGFPDWGRMAGDDEIAQSVAAIPGRAAFFDHRMLHQSPAVAGPKLILRTDIVFQRCGWPRHG